MANEATPEQIAALNQRINQPDFRQGYQSAWSMLDENRGAGAHGNTQNQYRGYLQRFGVTLPHDYSIRQRPDGSLEVTRDNLLVRNPWMIPAAAVGTGFGLSALGVGGPAAASSPAATGIAAANSIPTTVGLAGAGGSGALSGILGRLASAGIPLGTALATRGMTGGNDGGGMDTSSPQMDDILNLALQRIRDQQPLQDAINTQSRMGLPTYARGGQ